MATSLRDTDSIVASLEAFLAGLIHLLFIAFYLLVWDINVRIIGGRGAGEGGSRAGWGNGGGGIRGGWNIHLLFIVFYRLVWYINVRIDAGGGRGSGGGGMGAVEGGEEGGQEGGVRRRGAEVGMRGTGRGVADRVCLPTGVGAAMLVVLWNGVEWSGCLLGFFAYRLRCR